MLSIMLHIPQARLYKLIYTTFILNNNIEEMSGYNDQNSYALYDCQK